MKTSVLIYTCKLKIINPSRKRDVVLCHDYADNCYCNIEEFGDNVPGQVDFLLDACMMMRASRPKHGW